MSESEKIILSAITDVEMQQKGTLTFFRLERQRLYDELEEKEQKLRETLEMLVQLIVLSYELDKKSYFLGSVDKMYEKTREILLKKIEEERKSGD